MANRTRYTNRVSPGSVRKPGLSAPWWPDGGGMITELVEYSDVVDGTATVLIGTVPAGAVYARCKVWVDTAFNSGGGDDALIVGTAGDTNLLSEDGHPLTADSETEEVECVNWAPTTDQLIYATVTHTGTVPSAGKARVFVMFKRPL